MSPEHYANSTPINKPIMEDYYKSSKTEKFTEVDVKAINTIRVLSAEMVQAANSGHPGAPMGCAPLAHVLFSRHLRCNPSNPSWINRDRFVLSNGHACALQYSLLHMLGYDVTIEDLKKFRQLGSKTPGHPECHMTPGIEVTTGPLGQGFANAVGLAVAEAHVEARFGEQVFDNYTYVLMGDGCMQEGVASEAASLAGHLKLFKLIVFYDDNKISIDGETDISFTENVEERFRAYGFNCLSVENGDEDLEAIDSAIRSAKSQKDRPTLIRVRTTIGKGSLIAGSEKAHGAPLGKDELARVKTAFGFSNEEHFIVPSEVSKMYAQAAERGRVAESAWNETFNGSFRSQYPEAYAEINRRFFTKSLPENFVSLLPLYEPSETNQIATRKLSENVLNSLAPHLPELVGGSADLTASNLTKWKGSEDFQSPTTGLGSYSGRYIRFGVREHAMFAMMNGLAAYGGFLPMGATFLNFITYGWGALRLAALSHLPGLYVMTHDSIGLGEDGPTHQPIETLAALRALPNCLCLRPADGNEVAGAYLAALTLARTRPAVLCLSRQNLPQLEGSSRDATLLGAYILKDFYYPIGEAQSRMQVILIATGSEVAIAKKASEILTEIYDVRIVSMPCWELFREQSRNYKLSILAQGVPVVSIEAGCTQGWQEWAHVPIGIHTFGASGPYKHVYEKFGLCHLSIAEKVLKVVEYYRKHPVPDLPCVNVF
jgi:transketolase